MLWQVRVLDGAKQRRLAAHEKQHQQQDNVALGDEGERSNQHQRDFEQLDAAH